MKLYIIILILSTTLFSCNKIKNKVIGRIKEELPANYSYKDAGIDQFYWTRYVDDNALNKRVPLIKPYRFSYSSISNSWSLHTRYLKNQLGNIIDPITLFNVADIYIYGHKPFEKDEEDSAYDSPALWFIIDTTKEILTFYKTQREFEEALLSLDIITSEQAISVTPQKSNRLPYGMLSPDNIWKQYDEDSELSWFPENIKEQLRTVKAKKDTKNP